VTPPSRAGQPKLRASARWRLTATFPQMGLGSLGWLLARRQSGAARRSRPWSRRHDDPCACNQRIDGARATDPEEPVGARPTASAQTRRQGHLGRGRRRANHRIAPPREGPQDLHPRRVGATDPHQPRATSPNRVSLPHMIPRGPLIPVLDVPPSARASGLRLRSERSKEIEILVLGHQLHALMASTPGAASGATCYACGVPKLRSFAHNLPICRGTE
jgi:hypothetical protein